MLIYIIHSDKYYSFCLPNEVSGNYVIEDYDENGFPRNLVNVVALDGKWIMSSNENVRIIIDNKTIASCELTQYSWYFLASSQGIIVLFVKDIISNTWILDILFTLIFYFLCFIYILL